MAKKKQSMRRVREGIYRRPSGKYVAPIYNAKTGRKEYRLPGVPPGGFDTLDEALDFKRQFESQERQRGFSDEACDHFAKRWPKDYPRPQRTTNRHNAERVKAFAKDFAGVPMGQITKVVARRWALEHPGHYKVIRALFSDAVRDGIVKENPFANLGLPEGKGRSDILVLTEAELALLVRTAEDVWDDYGRAVFGPLIVTAAYTGMRPGELYALRRSDVDFERDEVRVWRQLQSKTMTESKPKGGKERTLVLFPPASAALKRIPPLPGLEHVFYNQHEDQFSQRVHHYYWSPVRAAFWAKLPADRQEEIDPGFDFYELRHFFGTLLANMGASPYDIADQMGHADGGALAMRRYIHTRSDEARERLKKQFREGQMLGGAGEEREAG